MIAIRRALLTTLAIGYASTALPQAVGDARWAFCPVEPFLIERPKPTRDDYAPGTIELSADEAYLIEHGLSRLTGTVEVTRDDMALRAGAVSFDDEQNLLEASGKVQLWKDTLFWQGERGQYLLDNDNARLDEGDYRLLDERGHGHADTLKNDPATDTTRLSDVDYTTCQYDKPSWVLSANSVTLDHEADRGHATHVFIKARGIPILYSPFLSFPLSDKRKSGFLVPSVGSSGDTGLDLRTPYYWNIAPNMDATFTPRLFLKRGAMLQSEYRYLFPRHNGQLELELLPSDSQRDDDLRAFGSISHTGYFGAGRGYLRALVQGVTDTAYFEDFGTSLSVTSQRFLERTVLLNYNAPYLYLGSLIQAYQSIDRSIAPGNGPYQRLPQVLVYSRLPQRLGRLKYGVDAEANYFDREDSVVGGRFDLVPYLTWSYRTAGVFFVPRLELRHTEYVLDDVPPGRDDHPHRTVPTVSIDSGLFLERDFTIRDTDLLQTLEPRVFYLYTPNVQQDDLPVFDSGLYDVSFQSIFYDNRYAGGDRIGDANQFTLALTSRLIGLGTGVEHLRASFGQIFYLRDREVTLPGLPEERTVASDMIGEVTGRLVEGWSARATVQWDPDTQITQKAALAVRYRPAADKLINVAYRRLRGVPGITDIEQTDVSFRWRITDQLHLIGRWNYSLQEARTLESVGGVEYDSCCWSAKVVARRYLRNTEGAFDNAFFVQIELKGLAGIGRRASTFLQESIPGYEPHVY